ncbi:MAG: class I SAM-dependent methyltransferase [Bacteroidota bacterium]
MMSNELCDICGTSACHWADIRGYIHYRCGGCGHLFVAPKPDQATLDEFYSKGEYYQQAESQKKRLMAEALSRVCLLGRIADGFGLERRLLDIGCASGFFLSAAKQAGWASAGTDRSEATGDNARYNFGVPVFIGIFEEIEVPGAPFSVVTCWEVIEHSTNPRDFFAAIARNVQSGGLLALSTPLANGFPAKILGTRFPMLSPPEHLSIFTRKSLCLLAEEFGFVEVDYCSFSNLTPRAVASGMARYLFKSKFELLHPISRVGLVSMGVIGAIISRLIDKIGQGTEMQVVFRKVQ